MKIRLATTADSSIIAQFNQAMAWETEQLKLDDAIINAGVAAVLNDSKKGFYLVAEIENEIAGSLMITFEWSDWRNSNIWWLQSVYVKPAFRKQKVFTTLLKAVEEKAKENGVKVLRLYMEHNNQQAQSTYIKNGFEKSHYVVFEKSI